MIIQLKILTGIVGENKINVKLEIQKDTKARDILDQYQIPYNSPINILSNGNFVNLDYKLKNEDIIKIIPIISGG